MSSKLFRKRTLKKIARKSLSVSLAVTVSLWLSGVALLAPQGVTLAAERPSVTIGETTVYDGDLIRAQGDFKVWIAKVAGDKKIKRWLTGPFVIDAYEHLTWDIIRDVPADVVTAFSESSLVRQDGMPEVYRLEDCVAGVGCTKRHIANLQTFQDLGLDWDAVFVINATEMSNFTTGEPLDTTGGTPPPSGEATLSVALAPDNPAASTIVADSTSGDGAQHLVPFLKLRFNAGSEGDVKVTKVTLTRSGISADTDISNMYLSDNGTIVADSPAVSTTKFAFSNTSGIFTVPAGTSKDIDVLGDIANGTSASKTIAFSVADAADIEATGSTVTVSGSFPLQGSTMQTATVSDLGTLTVATISQPGSVNPGETNFEVWRFRFTAGSQKIQVERVRFENIGTVDANDLQNFKFMDGDTQYGDTVQAEADKSVVFDLSDNPLVLNAGQVKTLSLKADIVGGTNRNFRFSFRNLTDIKAKDLNYGVYIKPNQSDTFTIIQAGSATSINAGSLTITRTADSPSGDVAKDALDQPLARFEFKAVGERVKVTSLIVQATTGDGSGLDNAKILLDGSQVGTTQDLAEATATTFSFGNTFIVDPESPATVEIRTDIKTTTAQSLTAGNTVKVQFNAGSSNAQGLTSGTTINTGAIAGLTLTVRSGALSAAKNAALPNFSATTPMGVPGASGVRVASFTLTAGTGEAVDITSLTIGDSSSAFGNFANLLVKRGDTGEQVGTTQGSLTAGSSYTFTPTSSIRLNAGSSIVFDVYADILTGASNDTNDTIDLDSVNATGVDTGSDAGISSATTGQTHYIATSGSLTVLVRANDPSADVYTMGQSGQVFGKFDFEETTSAEDVLVTQIVITGVITNANTVTKGATSGLTNIRIQATGLDQTLSALAADGTATFNTNWSIPKGQRLTLTVTADTNTNSFVDSGAKYAIRIAASGISSRGAVSGTSISSVPSSNQTAATHHLRRSKIKIDTITQTTSETVLTGSPIVLHRFTVSAIGNDASWKKLTFTISTTSATVTNFKLFEDATNRQINTSAVSAVNGDGQVEIYAGTSSDTTEEQIGSGASRTYRLEADLEQASSGTRNVSVYIASDAAVPSADPSTVTVQDADSNDNVIWSDRSASSHSTTTFDWTNGYLIDTLPSGTWVRTAS